MSSWQLLKLSVSFGTLLCMIAPKLIAFIVLLFIIAVRVVIDFSCGWFLCSFHEDSAGTVWKAPDSGITVKCGLHNYQVKRKRKGKEEYLYSAFLHQGTLKALRRGSHSFTCKQHHACLSFRKVEGSVYRVSEFKWCQNLNRLNMCSSTKTYIVLTAQITVYLT